MVKSCCAYKCTNVWIPNQGIQYHRFPLKNPALLEQWVRAARLENFTPTPHTLICSQHFKEEDYSESTLTKKRLKPNVVPSVFNFPSSSPVSKMDLEPDIFKIKEEIKEEDIVDEACVKQEQNYTDVTSNFCYELNDIRCKIEEDVKEEEPCYLEGIVKHENDANTSHVKTETIESEEDIYIGDFEGNALKPEELDIKDIINPDLDTTSSARAETSAQYLRRNPKNDANTLRDTECEYQTFKKTDSSQHPKTRSLKKRYSCSVCFKSFPSRFKLDDHIVNQKDDAHQNLISSVPKKVHKCTECDFETHSKLHFNKHARTHDPEACSAAKKFGCAVCSKLFHRRTDLYHHILSSRNDNAHLSLVSSISSKIHECSHCGYKTTLKCSLSKHLLKHSKPSLKCTKCDFETQSKLHFNKHSRTHDPEACSAAKKFACAVCSRLFNRRNHLYHHILSSRNDNAHLSLVSSISSKIYECSYCGYKTTLKYELSKHLRKHSKLSLKCDKCDFETYNRNILSKHLLRHTEPPLKCNKCNFETYNRNIFSKHLLVHSKPSLKCIKCDFETSCTNTLSRHLLNHEKTPYSYPCTVCNQSFREKKKLQEHIVRNHYDEPNSDLIASVPCEIYKCIYCDFKSTIKGTLSSHYYVHTNEMKKNIPHNK